MLARIGRIARISRIMGRVKRRLLCKFAIKSPDANRNYVHRIDTTKHGETNISIDITNPAKTGIPQSAWMPLYPELQQVDGWQLHSGILILLEERTQGDIAERFSTHIEEVVPHVYRCQLFSRETTQKVSEELTRYMEYNKEGDEANSMHEYGIVLDALGWTEALQGILFRIQSIFLDKFPHIQGYALDHHHSFMVLYSDTTNRYLDFHADDSEITFNWCLQNNAVGTELYVQGRRCAEHRQTVHHVSEYAQIEQIENTVLIHSGDHRHGVLPLLQGQRMSIITWAKSSAYRKSDISSTCHVGCDIDHVR